jgi:hypothetical protein
MPALYALTTAGAFAVAGSLGFYGFQLALGIAAYLTRNLWVGYAMETKLRDKGAFMTRTPLGMAAWVFLRFFVFVKTSIFNADLEWKDKAEVDDVKKDKERAFDYIFKLIENIKLVVVFLMGAVGGLYAIAQPD